MKIKKQTITMGVALAVAVLAAAAGSHVWLALPLLAIAILLFAWGLEPQRTEEFIRRVPYGGNYVLKALAKFDTILSGLG